MDIKWNKQAVKQLLDAIEFLEERNEFIYAEKLEAKIFRKVKSLTTNVDIYQPDRLKKNNDGSFFALEVDSYRISYRVLPNEIRILRIRHTSRRPFTK
jgi:plasmid stabilization system protein ParE